MVLWKPLERCALSDASNARGLFCLAQALLVKRKRSLGAAEPRPGTSFFLPAELELNKSGPSICGQITLRVMMLVDCRRTKSAFVVDKDDPGRLEKDQHIRFLNAIN